jgi:hypothetical protein
MFLFFNKIETEKTNTIHSFLNTNNFHEAKAFEVAYTIGAMLYPFQCFTHNIIQYFF